MFAITNSLLKTIDMTVGLIIDIILGITVTDINTL